MTFTDANRGTIVGDGTILQTTDGGASWVDRASGTSAAFWILDNRREHRGCRRGAGHDYPNRRWRCDLGASASRHEPVHPGGALTSTLQGTAVGDSGLIFRTTDGGRTWVTQLSGTNATLRGVCFNDAMTGCAVGIREVWMPSPGEVAGLNKRVELSSARLMAGIAGWNDRRAIKTRCTGSGSQMSPRA